MVAGNDAAQIVARYWETMNTNDFRAAAELFSDDYVLEWPQSGERIRGREAFARINETYPASGPWRFTVERLQADGEEVVSVTAVTDGTVSARAITFSTVHAGRIARQIEYWPDPFDPPSWRAAWVEVDMPLLPGDADNRRPAAGPEAVDPPPVWTIREATAADAAELTRLNALFNGSSDAPPALAARLADPRRVEWALVAAEGTRLVAFAGLRVVPGLFYAEPQAELTELYVEPDHRRSGLGRALVEEAARHARSAGATGLVVRTGEDNEAALALYHACGFRLDDVCLWRSLDEPPLTTDPSVVG